MPHACSILYLPSSIFQPEAAPIHRVALRASVSPWCILLLFHRPEPGAEVGDGGGAVGRVEDGTGDDEPVDALVGGGLDRVGVDAAVDLQPLVWTEPPFHLPGLGQNLRHE